MNEDSVLNTIAEIVAEEAEDIRPADVVPEASLAEDLGIDSLTLMTIVSVLEDKYSVEIADDDLAAFETVGDIEQHLQRLLER